MSKAQYLVFFCPLCQEARYRSIKELKAGENISPTLFRPIGDAPPPPASGPPMCHACQSMMKLVPETVAAQLQTAVAEEQAAPAASPDYATPLDPTDMVKSMTLTFFECRPDEEIKEIQDGGGALLVITNRRIVAIRKG